MEETNKNAEPMRNHDGSVMLDESGRVVYRSQFLATHPLRSDCKERMSDGKALTYITGESVIRVMNQVFGVEGWTTAITNERQVSSEMVKGKHVICFLATVKVTILKTGASHEDVGCGEGRHESKIKAIDNAIKCAVTDAMKRAARHFGERLGNALYVQGNGANRAPWDNKTALRDLQRKEAFDLFGNQQELDDRTAASALVATASTCSTFETETATSTTDETLVSGGNHQGDAAPVATLERQSTPTMSNVTHIGDGKEHSPSQQPPLGHGFARASQVVTPGQQQREQAGVTVAAAHRTATSANKPSPPPRRFAPLNTPQPSLGTNIGSNHHTGQNPTKRQKIVHNPYQN
jgi:DNA recombination protein Rad52